MLRKLAFLLLVGGTAALPALFAPRQADAQPPLPPPYEFILRSRSAEVMPERNKDGQTGGAYVEVLHPTLDTVIFVMRGAVVAGSETHRSGAASLRFVLDQEFDVLATRPKRKQPRLSLSGQLIGALMSSQPQGGEANQGAACAAINAAGQPVLQFCIKPHCVSATQNLFVNDRQSAGEAVVSPGGYSLHQVFELSATAPPIETWCPKVVPAAAAVFSPEPRLNARFNYVLAPFAAVPAKEFGFRVLLRVSEDSPLPAPALEPAISAPELETSLLPMDRVQVRK